MFFLVTLYWCSSRIMRMVRGQISKFLLNGPPTNLLIFGLYQHNVPQKIIFFTLGVQINVRVQINVLAGKLVKNNKRTGPNKGMG